MVRDLQRVLVALGDGRKKVYASEAGPLLKMGKKLVAAHGRGEGELYDLEADPKETKNLWDDPEYRGVKLEMYERLVDRMAWTVDPLPERQAEW